MKKSMVIEALSVVFVLAAAVSAGAQSSGDYQPRLDRDGWEILFDGKDLDAWTSASRAGGWAVNAAGELYPARPGRDLCTRQRYCDYVIEADFKMGAKRKANSGVFIRVHDPNNDVNTGMEVQILDNGDYGVPFNAGNANGALYDLVRPAVDANKPIGQWNHFRITVDQDLVTVELNGKEIVRADLSRWVKAGQNPDGGHNKFPHAIGELPREGFVCLQNYGATPVWFRNVRLKPLSDRRPQYTGKEPIEKVLRKGPAEEKHASSTVTGRVMIDGAAMAKGYVAFTPIAGSSGRVVGTPIHDGEYRCEKVPPGRFKVTITVQAAESTPVLDQANKTTRHVPKDILPPACQYHLRAEVLPGENQFDFDLQRK